MPFQVTRNAINASAQGAITPEIVLEIEGYDQIFGVVPIISTIEYGDDIFYGDPGLFYGKLVNENNSFSYISFKAGTTAAIRQQLNTDKGVGDSISSMRIALIDKDATITRDILTPDDTFTPTRDILGRRAKVWLGFAGTEYKEDYFVIFRGNIDAVESKPGVILFSINHPDSKKKSNVFNEASTGLNGAINNSVTTITVDSAADFLDSTFTGPSGAIDSNFEYLLRIDDEVIKYTGQTGTTFTGLTRGYLGTTAASHGDDAAVNQMYRITGNAMDIALKLMLSGWGGDFLEDIQAENFVRISGTETVDNSIFFEDINLTAEYNIQIGDYVTTTGATNGANNVALKEIIGLTITEVGSYIIVSGVSFVEENDTAALVSFRSPFDTFPDGARMQNDEVDIDQHLSLRNSFLSDDLHYDFRLDESIDLKDFISEQVYNPLSVYSVPKNARSSVGFHLNSVLPTSEIKFFDSSNVVNPGDIALFRSVSKNFFNSIVYRFESDILDKERFFNTYATISATSLERINTGIKSLKIDSLGLRTAENGENFAQASANRRLNKFQFGAETLKPVRVNFETGFNLEIGDVVLVNMADLKISDIRTGTRAGDSRLFEIINKELDIRSGKVTLELLDPNFSEDSRVGLISPTSLVKFGVSQSVFNIKQSFSHPHGVDEYRLWLNYVGAAVRVRSQDYSVAATSTILSISGNQITLSSNLGFIPVSDYYMEMAHYDSQNDIVKLIYTFMQDDPTFADGTMQYIMF